VGQPGRIYSRAPSKRHGSKEEVSKANGRGVERTGYGKAPPQQDVPRRPVRVLRWSLGVALANPRMCMYILHALNTCSSSWF
jgi:hypothetical protein